MFKALKWAYNRGREYERMRLKRMATDFMQSARYSIDQFGIDQLRHGENDNLRAERKKRQIEIDQQVIRVLELMIYPDHSRQEIREAAAPIDGPIDGLGD